MSVVLNEVYDLCLRDGRVVLLGDPARHPVPPDVDPVLSVTEGVPGSTFVHSTSWRWTGSLLLTWVRCFDTPRPAAAQPLPASDPVLQHAVRHLAWLARRGEPALSEQWRTALQGVDESPAGRLDA